MTATVGAIPVQTQTVVPVDTGAIVIGMTTGAIRLVRGRCPAHDLGITLVTSGAFEVASMIQRLEEQAGVHEGVGYPEIRRVAVIAG